MRKKYHLLTLITLFFTVNLSAQPIELKELVLQVDASLNSINTVTYKIEHFNKYLARKDTLQSTAICSLLIVPKDKMKSYHNIDLEFEVEKGGDKYFGQRIYNGEKVLWYSRVADSLTTNEKPEIYSDKKMKYSVVNGYSDLLLMKYFGKKDNFSAYGSKLLQKFYKGINVTEELLHGKPVYILNIYYKDEKDTTRDRIEKHYFRKTDFLPIAYYSFLRWENMEQYNYYEIDYVAINNNISTDDFKIDESEPFNAIELYRNFKNQINK